MNIVLVWIFISHVMLQEYMLSPGNIIIELEYIIVYLSHWHFCWKYWFPRPINCRLYWLFNKFCVFNATRKHWESLKLWFMSCTSSHSLSSWEIVWRVLSQLHHWIIGGPRHAAFYAEALAFERYKLFKPKIHPKNAPCNMQFKSCANCVGVTMLMCSSPYFVVG